MSKQELDNLVGINKLKLEPAESAVTFHTVAEQSADTRFVGCAKSRSETRPSTSITARVERMIAP